MTSSSCPGRDGEAAAGEQHGSANSSHGTGRLGAELVQHVAYVGPEVLVGYVAAAVAHQAELLRQQIAGEELVERRQHHPLGQVTGGAVQDDHGRHVDRPFGSGMVSVCRGGLRARPAADQVEHGEEEGHADQSDGGAQADRQGGS